ncbi:unnamed protein product [Chironomus riparius]|uniref:peptidylprolyl isomerase n=1 Tax=Chironomus riparius TaxID=315576 RepID=A0A9N9WNF4_9DIPT|nr:unnamed protein product [Chironomus riparius]
MAEQIDLSNDGGVLKEILKEGEGSETPSDGCTVSCHYTGTLLDGTKFDSSVDRGEPFEFQLGKGQVIKSWDIGVASMKKGEKCVLTCAPDYAYGKMGSPPNIPPESTLKFELELLGWKGQDVSKNGDGGVEKYIVTKSDKKKTPNDGALVKCHITGTFEGRVFDDRDVEFNIGEGEEYNVVSGIESGLEKMTQGEVSRLVIQPKYAFGADGNEQFQIPSNSTVEYVVTLNEFEKEIESWKLDADESLVQAKMFKDKGTNYFKQDKFKMALKFYEKCQAFLSNCDCAVDGEAKNLHISVYLNKALCHQKLNDQDEVRHACDEVLSKDPKNLKAFFRRGQASLVLGEVERALGDFEKAQEIEPENKAALNQITICKQKLKAYRDQEKKVYRNMFAKFAAADYSNEPKPLVDEYGYNTKFGEWKDEERSHSMTKFEEENPDLIMCDNPVTEVLKNM